MALIAWIIRCSVLYYPKTLFDQLIAHSDQGQLFAFAFSY